MRAHIEFLVSPSSVVLGRGGHQARPRLQAALQASLVVAASAVLLVAFSGVVRDGVRQGAARRAAELERTEAIWRCNFLRDKQARADCLAPMP